MMSVVNTVKTYVSQQNFVSYIRYKLSSILILFFSLQLQMPLILYN